MKKVWLLLCHPVTWGAYDTPVSSNQTDGHDIAEILSKMGVALHMHDLRWDSVSLKEMEIIKCLSSKFNFNSL
jgi:hypothetical protein